MANLTPILSKPMKCDAIVNFSGLHLNLLNVSKQSPITQNTQLLYGKDITNTKSNDRLYFAFHWLSTGKL